MPSNQAVFRRAFQLVYHNAISQSRCRPALGRGLLSQRARHADVHAVQKQPESDRGRRRQQARPLRSHQVVLSRLIRQKIQFATIYILNKDSWPLKRDCLQSARHLILNKLAPKIWLFNIQSCESSISLLGRFPGDS